MSTNGSGMIGHSYAKEGRKVGRRGKGAEGKDEKLSHTKTNFNLKWITALNVKS